MPPGGLDAARFVLTFGQRRKGFGAQRGKRVEQESKIQRSGKLIANRYEVVRPLGRGGIGKVFLCIDKKTDQPVALKMLRTKYQDNDKAIARFVREVNTVRSLDHPCIVKVFDASHDNGQLFYTMEYIEGKTLRQWIGERGRLPFGSVVRVLSLLAHALEHAHQTTIHRDLSPENVMVMADGSVRLLDFGLAKLQDNSSNLTMIGMSLGKLAYVAPEQRVNAAKVDHRADIYPLGVMFFETLTGELPALDKDFTKLRPDMPASVVAFLEKAMAYKAEDRFGSALEFREALMKVYEDREQMKQNPSLAVASPNAPATGGLLQRVKEAIASLRARFRRKPRD